jgi:rhodanese-related sulfurtransferase
MNQIIEFLQHSYNWAWAATALISGGLLLWPLLRSNKAEVSPATATLMMNREDAVVLDVRETAEWNGGHIASARHLALGQFDKHLVEIEKLKQTPLIICCATGGRSQGARDKLVKAGFEKVFNLAGGVAAWSEAGLPLTKKA